MPYFGTFNNFPPGTPEGFVACVKYKAKKSGRTNIKKAMAYMKFIYIKIPEDSI